MRSQITLEHEGISKMHRNASITGKSERDEKDDNDNGADGQRMQNGSGLEEVLQLKHLR